MAENNLVRTPFCQIELSNNGKVLLKTDLPPEHITNMMNDRTLGDTTDKFEIDLIDPSGIEIEQYLIIGARDIKIRYGDNITPTLEFRGTVYDFDSTFVGSMMSLHISGICSKNFVSTSKLKTRKENWKQRGCTSPSDVVKMMVSDNEDWTEGTIVDTQPVDEDLNQTNVTDITYIQDVLIPLSVSADSKALSNYYLSFDSNGTDKVIVNYAPAQATDISASFTLKYNNQENAANYLNSAEVIAFNSGVKGSVLMSGADGLSATGTVAYSNDQVLSSIDSGQTSSNELGFNYEKGATNIELKNLSTMSKSDIKNYITQRYKAVQQYVYKAQVDVVGNSNVPLGKFVEVIVMTKNGYHHSSGLYWVIGITDNITKGSYKQSLTLVKNSTNTVSINGSTVSTDSTDDSTYNTTSGEEGNDTSEWTEYEITAYCPCKKCCGKTDGITASGTTASPHRTVACAKSIPFGATVYIKDYNGDGKTLKFVCEDRGGAIGNKRIDVFYKTHQEALNFGRKKKMVKITYNGDVIS